ncbi:hypothetical protein AVEN_81178-1 [Araneus ventricosus]|uniref:Uncharacterized protein n=1 Tax=Araneus ventricosus TaxID=182803 RepID=A0A4Y2H977_ARAVE|nr:hypothetical protein AVEN_272524-1 [Araneus ventricosus]GBM61839.1 hypothetical protein AVEN_260609-1 [Araneus ventricosus]GBO17560.1 hypothetical protein AVEN_81178-1 [Araneus ventricosus]
MPQRQSKRATIQTLKGRFKIAVLCGISPSKCSRFRLAVAIRFLLVGLGMPRGWYARPLPWMAASSPGPRTSDAWQRADSICGDGGDVESCHLLDSTLGGPHGVRVLSVLQGLVVDEALSGYVTLIAFALVLFL